MVVLPLDELGHHAAEGLDAQRQRRHVEQEDVLDVARQHAGLDRGADRHDLVRVDALVRLLAAEHGFLTASMTAGMRVWPPTRMTSSMSVGFSPASLSADWTGPLVRSIRSATRSSSLALVSEMTRCLGPVGVGRDVGQVDLRLGGRGQLDLGLLGRLLQALEGLRVLGEVDALVLLELGQQPLDDALVEVVAAKVRVAVGGLDLEDAVAQLEDRDVERAAAQVVDGDLLVLLLVQAVGEGRGGRLVDDPLDVEAGDAAGVLGRLALGVVEVGRDGDDRLGDLLAEVRLGVVPQLLQDHRADLGRRVLLAVRGRHDDAVALGILLDLVGDELEGALDLRIVPAAAHEALDRVDRVRRVGDRLSLGDLADQPLTGLGEGDDRRNGPSALGARDDGWLAALHHRYDGVGGSKVNADDPAHLVDSSGCIVVDAFVGHMSIRSPV